MSNAAALKQVYTLAIIKPDILIKKKQSVDTILQSIGERFTIHNDIKPINLSVTQAEQFYNDHRGKFFFERLVCFMTRGPIVPLILTEKNNDKNTITSWREFIGPTHAENARKIECLRGKYGSSDTWNGFHGSGSNDEATQEINFFFPTFLNDTTVDHFK
ncbi:hypothetical protein DFA_01206 [Cavenderia fasciculata]|uniref:Nucleoside diphosphate kinase-like domain-containing protein n=1 Tax=Cavenderia fasciculata TaxID=261658 RepID=F4PRI5_CACFS|nr:uncharacterized protein DFA_01206 [Cavenderia fasciculata]EGG21325.1 hypothetical protein DFA_01206 [Cavenderia fasciculata]|eukprot:XP_004359175.1 hypothetical protein DFA_01206 [Cavenderia fasciculata]